MNQEKKGVSSANTLRSLLRVQELSLEDHQREY